MAISLTCSCGKRFDVPDSYAGRRGACTSCGAPLLVPSGGTPELEASDDQLAAFGAGGGAASGGGGQDVQLSAPTPGGAPPAQAPQGGAAVSVGRAVGGYQLERKLGGPKSSVFLARASQGPVALKILPHEIVSKSPTTGKRFLREARSLFGLGDESENVVRCLDAGEELGTYYLAMEYVQGGTLGDLLDARGGRLPEREALDHVEGATRGLQVLHARSLVHRNVKPEHLLVGAERQVKLIGLGLVRETGEEMDGGGALTVKGTIVGTPQYMSPEQARGDELDPRSDLYSLGITLYRTLTGEVPFDHKNPARVLSLLNDEPVPPVPEKAPEASAAVAAVVERLVQKQPEDRYQSAEDLLTDLEAIRTGRLVAGIPPTIARQAASGGRDAPAKGGEEMSATVKLLAALVAVLVLVVIVLLAVILTKL